MKFNDYSYQYDEFFLDDSATFETWLEDFINNVPGNFLLKKAEVNEPGKQNYDFYDSNNGYPILVMQAETLMVGSRLRLWVRGGYCEGRANNGNKIELYYYLGILKDFIWSLVKDWALEFPKHYVWEHTQYPMDDPVRQQMFEVHPLPYEWRITEPLDTLTKVKRGRPSATETNRERGEKARRAEAIKKANPNLSWVEIAPMVDLTPNQLKAQRAKWREINRVADRKDKNKSQSVHLTSPAPSGEKRQRAKNKKEAQIKKILELQAKDSNITQKELAQQLELNEKTIRERLKEIERGNL